MKSIDFKYENLKNAYKRLEAAATAYDGADDMIRDSLIQRFEFTYELCHKTLYELMRYEGETLKNSFPRTVFKRAYANRLIEDERTWIELMEDRNATSHVYDEAMADEIAGRIKLRYAPMIGRLVRRIGKEIE